MASQEEQNTRAGFCVFAGIFLLSFGTLMYELLLTRIFSVTVYYHFAFMALSVAMFGTALGGIIVFVQRDRFSRQNTSACCSISSAVFAITEVIALIFHLNVPIMEGAKTLPLNILLTWGIISLPFIAGGIALSLIFRKFPKQIGSLYGADLLGAGLGCIALLVSLRFLDGLSAVLLNAALVALGSVIFALPARSLKLIFSSGGVCLALFAVLGVNSYFYEQGQPIIRITWAKGSRVYKPLYEKWNSFSWIAVSGDPNQAANFTYSGISSTYVPKQPLRGLNLDIDGSARTSMVGWEKDLNKLDVFKADIANIAHHVRPDATVAIIGAGGGKDVVSALVFNQKHVTGIEINENTLAAVNKIFGEFTGHLDRNARVSLINDEARSYLSRCDSKFDIIQMPFIDTWAATSNGAFVLTENSLYTVEAWKVFIGRLTDNGIFTVSRWYVRKGRGEILRMLGLASESLREMGVANPRRHIILLRRLDADADVGVGTLLICRSPFSKQDIQSIVELTKRLKFDVVVGPDFSEDEMLATMCGSGSISAVAAKIPLNVYPPYDDSPFFFNMVRPADFLHPDFSKLAYDSNVQAVLILLEVLVISIAATYLCMYLPMKFAGLPTTSRMRKPMAAFFLSIGISFMFIEISQIQRLIVFLGHPVYGISIVVCPLLVASGLGSYLVGKMDKKYKGSSSKWMLMVLILVAMAIVGLTVPIITTQFRNADTIVRIILSGTMVSLLGLFLGIAFPTGVLVASRDSDDLLPWYWSINGAGSVLGSVVAVFISLVFGITALYWTGFVGYFCALLALMKAESVAPQ